MKHKTLHRKLLTILSMALPATLMLGVMSHFFWYQDLHMEFKPYVDESFAFSNNLGQFEEKSVDEAVEAIVLDGNSYFPNVQIVVSDTNTLKITGQSIMTNIEVKDKVLHVSSHHQSFGDPDFSTFNFGFFKFHVRYPNITIEVPKNLKNITINDGVRNVDFDGANQLSLENLKVGRTTGDINIKNLYISHQANLLAGGLGEEPEVIYLENITGNPHISAEAARGNIIIQASQIREDSELSAVWGNVEQEAQNSSR